MRQHWETRAHAYRRTFEDDGFEPDRIRRAKRIRVPIGGAAALPDPPDSAWLEVFERELDEALDDYEDLRLAGLPTYQLAAYIAYLAECVVELAADPKRGLLALGTLRGKTPA